MREAHPIERAVGMDYYVSDADGVGGRLRVAPEDFRVTELEAFDVAPVDADPSGYPHVVCRVELRNWDTNDFAGALSDRLGISRERVSWAGTKDKRAVTRQLFSVDGIDPEDVPELDGADIEVVGRAGRPILFGDLAGNAFEIAVRDAEFPENAGSVFADLRAFAGGSGDGGGEIGTPDSFPEEATAGVPNYFGQQRFGSRRPVTHAVGLEIVRGDWEGAVLAYVGNPHDREPEATQEAREYVEETRDWAGALDRLPRALGYERSMCHALVDNGADGPEDFREAVETLPTNLQTLFVNAAQSYVFNRILSARLERGLPFDRPVEGDVVCFSDSEVLRTSDRSSGRSPRDSDAPDDLALPDPDRIQRVTEKRLRTVERHCERGRAFVTAPLVGTETELADGEPGEIERDVLADVGLEPADFDLPGNFHSEGTRRAMLLRTDLGVDRDGDDLTFSFSLPKGSYATVVLREFRKGDPDE
ncbi:tRNA pseudouridine(13) synthase TruD [Haloarcula nitratireducens]|uniref:Probable tRNA pseudouridine synthase D n=1 Tax=Haloarcula nitratireducens TaxID=2487749 RepID=A0AAW4P6W5_9EURY|nr:tRNA pseudouridine(13) synthase TruD [Halomicroarcula nitratireducens]MBX0293368.1 tRNA pseudouridine(13) synthase TruD [Halomicroarcula nitratireducens]